MVSADTLTTNVLMNQSCIKYLEKKKSWRIERKHEQVNTNLNY